APPAVDLIVCTMAATPEVENHGAALLASRDATARLGTLRRIALVDESAFAARLGGDPALASRMAERRQAWREFTRRHGWEAFAVNLESVARAAAIDAPTLDALRSAGRSPA
ncbi:MAG: hypothetical protein ACR2I8_09420, partial [Steroidobacteraceae bacterium]